jgi:hypothetical protein
MLPPAPAPPQGGMMPPLFMPQPQAQIPGQMQMFGSPYNTGIPPQMMQMQQPKKKRY